MIQAKPGQIVLERRKEPPAAPVAERTEPVRPGVSSTVSSTARATFPEVTVRDLVERWNRGAPGSEDLVVREKQWEAVTPAGRVLGVVRAPTRETARELAMQGFEVHERLDGVGTVLVRYVGTVVQVVRKGGNS